MTFAVVCAAHAPLASHDSTVAPQKAEYLAAMKRTGDWVREFAPDLIIEFAQDHFNGFFYRLMPSFCIGIEATAIGDWATCEGPLNVPASLARDALQAVQADEIDCAISYRMTVDHGFTQVLELMFGNMNAYPVIPVMINCAAPPRPTFRRVRLLGEALGHFARRNNLRVLFLGSGGLSHDPPMVKLDGAETSAREAMIVGGPVDQQARAARENRVVKAALGFAEGRNGHRPPNAPWDRQFMALLQSGDLGQVDSWQEDEITDLAGSGGHEVRAWIAAFAALSAAKGPNYVSHIEYYEAVMLWMTGMGIMRGQ
jgi:2,3-dihydroxyphenylpropionate 1,2-dioxygenase